MMKKIGKIALVLLFASTIFITQNVSAVSNTTSLKDLKDQLAALEEKAKDLAAEKARVQSKINEINKEIEVVAKEINDCEEAIEESRAKVAALEVEIQNKQLEIDNLVNFLQISEGENIYLEYIFKAKSFTDFIYRAAVVEQLTKYNDGLIDEMNALIEENKKVQAQLAEQIVKAEEASAKLQVTLSKYNINMNQLDSDHYDAEQDLIASRKEVQAYEKVYNEKGCPAEKSILDCVGIPYADGLIRPVNSGSITSEYGMRLHPTQGVWKLHNGLDIGVPMNTPVYASAAGIVSKKSQVANPNAYHSSCGGNVLYIKHRVDGKEVTTVYMHLHSFAVNVGDFVTTGTIVGYSGGGESYDSCTTGPHLHFSVMVNGSYVSPRNYIDFPAKGGRFYTRY